MKQLLNLCFLIVFIQYSFGEDLICEYTWGIDESTFEIDYICTLYNSLSDTSVVEINGDHLDPLSYDNVTTFKAENKEISKIPKLNEIFVNLKIFIITNSDFSSLTKADIEDNLNVRTLKALTISKSRIVDLPADTFSTLEVIEIIDLSSNQIEIIKENTFTDLASIKTINLRSNKIFLIGDAFPTSTTATDFSSLDLSGNKCKFESDALQQNCINDKDCIQNLILAITESTCNSGEYNVPDLLKIIEDLEKSKATVVKENEGLRAQRDTLHREIDLLKTDIRECKGYNGTCLYTSYKNYNYACIAVNIEVLSSSKVIQWYGEKTSSTNDNKNVKALVISGLKVEAIPKDIGIAFKNLEALIIQNSGLKKLEIINFDRLFKLKDLQITSNNITSIETGVFDDLTALNNLDLSNNELKTLPSKFFAFLTNLETLNLSNNQISSVKSDLISTTNGIKFFMATNNNFTNVDQNFVYRLRNAKVIDFSGNRCNQKYNADDEKFTVFYSRIIKNC